MTPLSLAASADLGDLRHIALSVHKQPDCEFREGDIKRALVASARLHRLDCIIMVQGQCPVRMSAVML